MNKNDSVLKDIKSGKGLSPLNPRSPNSSVLKDIKSGKGLSPLNPANH